MLARATPQLMWLAVVATLICTPAAGPLLLSLEFLVSKLATGSLISPAAKLVLALAAAGAMAGLRFMAGLAAE
ncbi:hypothetical protein COT42_01700 [Candidatus Saganbacteria bacterium CG08_land_8_20_14_0_20_45_16]|uniref:Uncharacterized protein n=1 Tax=Candidatus Saganbacteria bacterium CG08_land_8_20_14_0_20_45_16 TaxID=2014293 RepID=A0A2H0Y0Z9_UNCSA|nr:MAG: hypothetical protein COT42_01700 [Candidatus Saganbacteria bacterium CG08_land_8_20_14_0_20_45_16]